MKKIFSVCVATMSLTLLFASSVYAQSQGLQYNNLPSYQTEISHTGQATTANAISIQPRQGAGVACVRGVNANSFLNVRSGPGTNFNPIGQLRNRTVVMFPTLGQPRDPNWMFIDSPVRGYVHRDFIGPAVDSLDPSAGCPA